MANNHSKVDACEVMPSESYASFAATLEGKDACNAEDFYQLVAKLPRASPALQAMLKDPEAQGTALVRRDRHLNLNSSKRTANLEAIGVQITGYMDDRGPCKACSEGKGPFVHCYTLGDGFASGACGNCHYNSNASRCDYRAHKGEQGRGRASGDGGNELQDKEEDYVTEEQGEDEMQGLMQHGVPANDEQKRKRRAFWENEISLLERDDEYGDKAQGEDSVEDNEDQPPHKHRNRLRQTRRRINYKIDLRMPDTDSDDLLSDREQPQPQPKPAKAPCNNNNNNNIHKNMSPGNRRSYSVSLSNVRAAGEGGGGPLPKFGFNRAQFQPADASLAQVGLQHPRPAGATAGLFDATPAATAAATAAVDLQAVRSAMRPQQPQVAAPQQPLVTLQQSSQRPGLAAPPPAPSAQPCSTQDDHRPSSSLYWPASAQAPAHARVQAPRTRPSTAPAQEQGPTPLPAAAMPSPLIHETISGAQTPLPQPWMAEAPNPALTPMPTQHPSPCVPATQVPQTTTPRTTLAVPFPFASVQEARRHARMLHVIAFAIEDAIAAAADDAA